ncbi:hypothetical protein ACFY3M_49930, partial [Streptomyces mirabilis]
GRRRHGSRWLNAALGTAAMAASRTKEKTYLGGDYYAKYDPERAMRRITRQANALGFTVRFDPIEAA